MTYEEWTAKYGSEESLSAKIKELAKDVVAKAMPVADAFASFDPRAGLKSFAWVCVCNWCDGSTKPLQLAVAVGVEDKHGTETLIVSEAVAIPAEFQEAAYLLEQVEDPKHGKGWHRISNGIDASGRHAEF